MKNEKDYFKKRDRDVMSGFGTNELEYVCNEIAKRDDYKKDTDNFKVLDIGCGSGMAMQRMQNEFLHLKNIRGVDISEFAIKETKNRKLKCAIDNAEQLNTIKNDEFDFAYGLHILEHTDPVKTLQTVMRVAKKAVFIFPIGETPDTNNEEKEFEFENKTQKKLFHNYVMTEELLLDILKKVKYERHKIVKNVITYIINGQKQRNYMLILYRDNPKAITYKSEKKIKG